MHLSLKTPTHHTASRRPALCSWQKRAVAALRLQYGSGGVETQVLARCVSREGQVAVYYTSVMTRELNGLELQGFIKQRQLRQVRNLRQEHHIVPKLVIIKNDHATQVIDTYVGMKVAYADDVLIEVEVASVAQEFMPDKIRDANQDSSVHGIIVQLPLDNPSETDAICNLIARGKDVDGLGDNAEFISATAEAIDWLLAGYNVELDRKRIALLGHGRLVGTPLGRLWRDHGYQVTALDDASESIDQVLRESDVIVSATGVPRILKSDYVAHGAVVVDAGTASENGQIVGDADPALRERSDLTITPAKGGVGPLTIAVLFDHVIQAAQKSAGLL